MPEGERDARSCRPPEFGDPHREPVNRQAWVRISGIWRRALVSRWWRTCEGLVVHLVYEDGNMQRAGYFLYDPSAIQPGDRQLWPTIGPSQPGVAVADPSTWDRLQRKVGTGQVCLGEVRATNAYGVDARAGEVGSLEVRVGEVRLAEIGLGQVRPIMFALRIVARISAARVWFALVRITLVRLASARTALVRSVRKRTARVRLVR